MQHFGKYLEDEISNTGDALGRAVQARQGQVVERLGGYFAGLLSVKECEVYPRLYGQTVKHASFDGKRGSFVVTIYTDSVQNLGSKLEAHLTTPTISTSSRGPVWTAGDIRSGVVFNFTEADPGDKPQSRLPYVVEAGYVSGTVRG